MWSRIIRLLTSMLSAYSFYTSPVRYMLSVLMLLLVPYLIYIFWGGLILFGLITAGCYFIYKTVKNSKRSGYHI